MGINISMIRIANRLKELFNNKIDMKDLKNKEDESHYYSRALAALALMMESGIDIDNSCLNITDGYNDMGVDAIYLDDTQKVLFLVQSKWRKDGNGAISQKEISAFTEGIKRLINLDVDGANDKVKAKINDVEEAISNYGYKIKAVFIHTGDQCANDYARKPIIDLEKHTNEVDPILDFKEIIERDIYTYLANGQESETITLDDVVLVNWGMVDVPLRAYYGIVSAVSIGEWYKTYGNKLFAQNIRYYKGSTSVNDGMKKVLIQEPENFFYFNNGIKILCKSLHRKAKESTDNRTGIFQLEGVSLVNGAQTTGTIGQVFSENKEQVSKANVMVQIIDLSQSDDDTASRITQLSNTQNRIENKDFVALDPVQFKIKDDLSFSHYNYIFKGGDNATDPSSQITFDEAIVALACLNADISYATMAKNNVGALSENIKKKPYKELMNRSTNSFEIINSVLVVRTVEKELMDCRKRLIGKARLVSVNGNRFIEYCILQELKNTEGFSRTTIDLQDKTKNKIGSLIDDIVKEINQLFPEAYPANVFKNTGRCKKLYESLINNTRLTETNNI